MIAIIDYGLGNIRSLLNWFKKGGLEAKLTSNPDEILSAELIVLPGVGAFEDAIDKLKSSKMDAVLKFAAREKKAIVGICLGMQLLYECSYEGGIYQGLGLLKGQVLAFDTDKLKVPHMGWNTLAARDDRFDGDYVYFVHSYYAKGLESDILAYTDYHVKVPAIVRSENILGFQFHPEKSGQVGERLLEMLEEFKDEYISSN